MAFADVPLTEGHREAVARHWSLSGGEALRLHGGEESATYRLGDRVVRIGPAWRSDEELEWCFGLARHAARRVPQALAPLPSGSGRLVVRVEGRPLSVWPFIEGAWGREDAPELRAEAAQLLARLHRALADWPDGPRPDASPRAVLARGGPDAPDPELADPELDAWLAAFERGHTARQPIHGDYYAGNTLCSEGRIAALLDWDDARVTQPERELAMAAVEWGQGMWTDDWRDVRRFIDDYRRAGGPARPLDDRAVFQLYRDRIRTERAYERAAVAEGRAPDEGERAYAARQLAFFRAEVALPAGARAGEATARPPTSG